MIRPVDKRPMNLTPQIGMILEQVAADGPGFRPKIQMLHADAALYSVMEDLRFARKIVTICL
jgi:hypothetical protein